MSCLNGTSARFLRSFYVCTPCLAQISRRSLPARTLHQSGLLPAVAAGTAAATRRQYATKDEPPGEPPAASTAPGPAPIRPANSIPVNGLEVEGISGDKSDEARQKLNKRWWSLRRRKRKRKAKRAFGKAPEKPDSDGRSPSAEGTDPVTEDPQAKPPSKTRTFKKLADKPDPDAGSQSAEGAGAPTESAVASRQPAKLTSKKKKPKAKKTDGDSDEADLMKGAVEVLKSILMDKPAESGTKKPRAKKLTSSAKQRKESGAGDGAGRASQSQIDSGKSIPVQDFESPAVDDTSEGGIKQASGRKSIRKAMKQPKEERAKGEEPSEKEREEPRPTVEKIKIEKINARVLELVPIKKLQPQVPRLAYGLDRVLFNPGVYHLQDPRSRVFNFDPYLAAIMPISEFDFNALKRYVTSSKDATLISIARENRKKYTGSTSSMTSTLAHFHFLLSSWRPINPAHTSRAFTPDFLSFTRISRAPSAAFLHWKDGTYAIDADKEFDTANVLSMLGRSMEKLLTLPKEEYEKYRRSNSDQLTDEARNGVEAFHYTTMGDFMMRSQLDAYDKRVPGTGMFDLKTRAVVSIRMDAKDFQKGLGYEIRGRYGQWESFEREYFDMIRSAFLKYSLQVRMGRMDGIFVAFHNTQRIFGFQYVPLNEMDLAIHGSEDTTLGDREFKLSLYLLNQVLDRATARFPGKSLRLHLETRPADPPFMYVFAKPVAKEEIDEVQNANRASVEEFERAMTGVAPEEGEGGVDGPLAESAADEEDSPDESGASPDLRDHEDDQGEDVWEDMLLKVEETMENDELGATAVREAIEDALEQSGLLRARSVEESRRYVDALLEAIIDPVEDGAAEEAEDRDDHGEHKDAERSPADSQSETAAESRSVELESPMEPGDKQGSSVETASKCPVGEEDDVEEDSEADEKSTPGEVETVDETASSDDLSLKDLIIRLAAQISEAPEDRRPLEIPDELGEDGVASDSLKLRKFERILSELTATSRDDENDGAEVETVSEEVHVEDTEAQIPTPSNAEPEYVELPDSTTGKPALPRAEDDIESSTDASAEGSAGTPAEEEEVLGLILTIRNKVDDTYVQRPERMTKKSSWTVEYSIQEMPAARSARLYGQLLARRQNLLRPKEKENDKDKDNAWHKMFRGRLHEYSLKGRQFREKETRLGRVHPVNVLGVDKRLRWEDVFGHVTSDAKGASGTKNGQ